MYQTIALPLLVLVILALFIPMGRVRNVQFFLKGIVPPLIGCPLCLGLYKTYSDIPHVDSIFLGLCIFFIVRLVEYTIKFIAFLIKNITSNKRRT